MTHRSLIVSGAVLAALAVAAPARALAQDVVAPAWGQSRGFSAGFQFMVDGIAIHDSPDPGAPHIDAMGGGFAILAGYTFTPRFHARVMLGSARHDTDVRGLGVLHSMGTLEAQYRFLPDRQVCPYIAATLGGTGVRADHAGDHVEINAATAGLGGGLRVSLSPRIVLELGARFEAVNWKDAAWSRDVAGGGTVQYRASIEEAGGQSRAELAWLWQF